ncbi:MAG: polysaccharide deacetylase family protein [Candidatus Krumholzibacteriia bacterium]
MPQRGGSAFPEARADALALLLLPPAAPAGNAARFATLDCAQAWGNWLLQEFGSLRTAPVADWAGVDLAGCALVVVPEGCAEQLDDAAHDRLEAFARDGGVVLYERSWRGRTADAAGAAPVRLTTAWLADGLADSLTLARLRATPFAAPLPRQPEPPAAWLPLVRVAAAGAASGESVVAVSLGPRGAGGILLVDLPLARQLVVWQQGLPADDFTIPLRHRAEAGVRFCQPNALVADAGLLDTLHPHADAWERLLAACVERVRPVPRLWYFPAAFDGAWAMTHDDENFGDLSRWMTTEERRRGVASTMYVIPQKITAQGVAGLASDGADLALHWWRGWSGDMTRPVGLFGWHPARRIASLVEQRDRLQTLGAPRPITGNRVHGLMWDPHYTRDFRRLEAAGFTLDSTSGPAGPRQLGYVFGTGFPFHPLDTDGRPFRLLEVPYLYQDDENWRPDLDETLLRDSATSLHELLVPLYHATTMRWQPSAAVMDGYLASFASVRRWNHWPTTLEGYRAFWARRAATPLVRGARPGEYAAATAPADSLALMVPAGARALAADGSEPPGRAVTVMGRAYRLVPLAALGDRFRLEARP